MIKNPKVPEGWASFLTLAIKLQMIRSSTRSFSQEGKRQRRIWSETLAICSTRYMAQLGLIRKFLRPYTPRSIMLVKWGRRSGLDKQHCKSTIHELEIPCDMYWYSCTQFGIWCQHSFRFINTKRFPMMDPIASTTPYSKNIRCRWTLAKDKKELRKGMELESLKALIALYYKPQRSSANDAMFIDSDKQHGAARIRMWQALLFRSDGGRIVGVMFPALVVRISRFKNRYSTHWFHIFKCSDSADLWNYTFPACYRSYRLRYLSWYL